MNRKDLMPCIEKIDSKARKVIKVCLEKLPHNQRDNNPVVKFWDYVTSDWKDSYAPARK
jgi:hypothetical protein